MWATREEYVLELRQFLKGLAAGACLPAAAETSPSFSRADLGGSSPCTSQTEKQVSIEQLHKGQLGLPDPCRRRMSLSLEKYTREAADAGRPGTGEVGLRLWIKSSQFCECLPPGWWGLLWAPFPRQAPRAPTVEVEYPKQGQERSFSGETEQPQRKDT